MTGIDLWNLFERLIFGCLGPDIGVKLASHNMTSIVLNQLSDFLLPNRIDHFNNAIVWPEIPNFPKITAAANMYVMYTMMVDT